jgi:hypothetical protein
MKFQEIQNNPQIFKALTTYTIEQFEQLLVLFQDELPLPKYALNGKKRKKKYVPRAPNQLPTAADKRFYYLKNNPRNKIWLLFSVCPKIGLING